MSATTRRQGIPAAAWFAAQSFNGGTRAPIDTFEQETRLDTVSAVTALVETGHDRDLESILNAVRLRGLDYVSTVLRNVREVRAELLNDPRRV
jgi:hypothetical protein